MGLKGEKSVKNAKKFQRVKYTSSAPKMDVAPSRPARSPSHNVSWGSLGGTNKVYLYPLGDEGLDSI